jgi:radical SAM superfamily enzyme YgiQ (UPF0313 family)
MKCLEALKGEGLVDWSEEQTDVLFVVPPFPTTYAPDAAQVPEYSSPPLGLAYVAGMLDKHGYRVTIQDLHVSSAEPEEVVSLCRRFRPRIVGITATTPSYPNAERVARFVKAWNPSVVTVIGGAHATCCPEETTGSGLFDFTVMGEGEYTMLELAGALLRGEGCMRDVPGLAFSGPGDQGRSAVGIPDNKLSASAGDSSGVIRTAPRWGIVDLDQLSPPARHLLNLEAYYQNGAIISARGCPFDCNFCACSVLAGRTYRVHSVENVLDEVEHLIDEYGIRHLDFHDDTFNLDGNRVSSFCENIERRGLDFRWGCFCRAAQLNDAMAKAMVKAGCGVIQIGVESGNDSVLGSIKKRSSLRQVEEAVVAASAAGVDEIVCGFIIGHAQDTPDTIRETIDFGLHLKSLGATRLTLSLLTPYPGTEVYERAEELGIRILTDDWEEYVFSRVVMETGNLGKEELREFYTRGLIKFLDAAGHTLVSSSISSTNHAARR